MPSAKLGRFTAQKYTAAILGEDGSELVPLDISGGKDDVQAEALARREARKWLAKNGHRRATVRILHQSFMLDIQLDIEVSR